MIHLTLHLFIYLGVYVAFNTVHVISRWVIGRAEETSTYSSLLYCKLPTNSKQLPAFPLEVRPGTKPWPQRWEVRVLPLCHRGPPSDCTSTAQHKVTDIPLTERQRLKDVLLSTSLRIFNLPLGIGPNDRGQPF